MCYLEIELVITILSACKVQVYCKHGTFKPQVNQLPSNFYSLLHSLVRVVISQFVRSSLLFQ